jgi:acyl-CoA thioesterase
MSLREASAVTALDSDRWSAAIAPGWDIVGAANGGYLLAMTARAAAAAAGRPDPVTVTAHYLAPGAPGPVTLETEVVKAGKRFSTVSATLRAERPLLRMLGSFGDLEESIGVERIEAEPPALPPVDECVSIEPTDSFPPPFMGRVELRLPPERAAAWGAPGGVPRVEGWFRLRDGESIDPLALLVAVDAFPPTIFFTDLPVAWVPTLELTAHVRARPAPGWLRCAFTTRFITGGFLEEDGEVWDETGRLVAQSRQLALVPRE